MSYSGSPSSTYTASVSQDILRYMLNFATGNDGCIQSMTAIFQPSGQSVTGNIVSSQLNSNVGFLFQRQNITNGVNIQITFFSTTIPQNTIAINLIFQTTSGNTYQLVQINTSSIYPNQALIIIVTLSIVIPSVPGVNTTSLLQTFTAFASSQCSTQKPPSLTYSGSGFNVVFSYTYISYTTFNALFIAQNTASLPNTIQVQVIMGGNTVASANILTPSLDYAYFLFTVALSFVSE